ncbi:hypothetical protein [Sporosarcina sp. 6E9]|uniref:hypothetical protein n=1 Tax=Sporosarcina sp. 6E9 TaxID=2819235 RepID=UPI001AD2E5EC|nr:hypothetical protein [Sporosarcina sp. 6E9]MBO1909669.1 hypothetical protein [Microvirga sp. 3-52]
MFRKKYDNVRVYGVYRTAQTLEVRVVEMKFEYITKKQATEKMYDYLFVAPERGGLGIGHRSILKIFTVVF